MVMNHDDDWSSIIEFDNSSLLDPHEFIANILASRDVYRENEDVEGSASVNRGQVNVLVPEADVTASQTAPSELSSQIDETLAICPKLRIVLVGNTNVGKSSLIASVFNIVFNVSLPNNEDGTAIDIAHDRAGKSDISHEYYSERFILHDSMGFEPGSTEKFEILRSFLRDRAECSAELPEQVHAIWLCIETPRKGMRLLQNGNEDLLELAKELNIPVIVVLTKYDLLIMEHYRACSGMSLPDRHVEVKKRVGLAFSEIAKELKVPCTPVSTLKKAQREYGDMMLVELIQMTRDILRDPVAGSFWGFGVTAQQINARQKVELSINEGLTKYWRDLRSDFFQGHPLVYCIERIHDDILKFWDFNDPYKVLSGEEFLTEMIRLVEPLSDEVIRNQRRRKIMDVIIGFPSRADDISAVSRNRVLPALGTVIGMKAFQFLCGEYQKGVSTAIYLAAYIVDLTLVLYEISTVVMVDLPKSLSTDLVMDALAIYKSRSPHIHDQVKEAAFSLKLEEKIASVIWDALPM